MMDQQSKDTAAQTIVDSLSVNEKLDIYFSAKHLYKKQLSDIIDGCPSIEDALDEFVFQYASDYFVCDDQLTAIDIANSPIAVVAMYENIMKPVMLTSVLQDNFYIIKLDGTGCCLTVTDDCSLQQIMSLFTTKYSIKIKLWQDV